MPGSDPEPLSHTIAELSNGARSSVKDLSLARISLVRSVLTLTPMIGGRHCAEPIRFRVMSAFTRLMFAPTTHEYPLWHCRALVAPLLERRCETGSQKLIQVIGQHADLRQMLL